MKRKVALFDFDGTLTQHDTLVTFAVHAVGRCKFFMAMCLSLPWIAGWKCGILSNSKAKEHLFGCLYRGMSLSSFDKKAYSFVSVIEKDIRPEGISALDRHRCCVDDIYIVSASIDRWIIPWARRYGIKNVIATKPEIDDAGMLTGRFLTPNCYGEEKVRRIKNEINDIEDCEVWAYGDSSGDEAMLAIADHSHRL